MITIPKLTEEDLRFMEGKNVFLYSYRFPPYVLYDVLKYFDIEVVGYSIASLNHQPNIRICSKNKMKRLNYIKPQDAIEFLNNQNITLVQLFGGNKEHFDYLNKELALLDCEISSLTSGEIVNSFQHLLTIKDLQNPFKYYKMRSMNCYHMASSKFYASSHKDKKSRDALRLKEFMRTHSENAIVICSPLKTADHTIINTFNLLIEDVNCINKNVFPLDYVNVWHAPNRINRMQAEKSFAPFKLIVGIREPISQNLSLVFHSLGVNANLTNLFYRELFESNPRPNRNALINKYATLFQNGIDVQAYWDIYTGFYTNTKQRGYAPCRFGLIQDFIPEFTKHVLDIREYPFDQEKGYTIIKDGNTEVFVYQLEKLNNLVPELSDWVGVPFDKLENGNQASDKWIAESYKQAQKEIEITQEYFDKCFNEPYVKHCYSEADIEKFKARWRPHIKKGAQ